MNARLPFVLFLSFPAQTIICANPNPKESDMDRLFGVIAEFDKAMIVHKDVRYFGSIRDELIDLTVKYRQLNHLEILIDGYDNDLRALYEVPEVRRWVKILHTTWPDFLFW